MQNHRSLLWVRFARLGLLSFYAPEEYVSHFAKSSKFLEMPKKDQLAFIRRFLPIPSNIKFMNFVTLLLPILRKESFGYCVQSPTQLKKVKKHLSLLK